MNSELLEFTWEVKLNGSFDFLRAESLAFPKDHEVARLAHDFHKELSEDVVNQTDALLRDAKLWLDLLQNSVDVSLEGGRVKDLKSPLRHSLSLSSF